MRVHSHYQPLSRPLKMHAGGYKRDRVGRVKTMSGSGSLSQYLAYLEEEQDAERDSDGRRLFTPDKAREGLTRAITAQEAQALLEPLFHRRVAFHQLVLSPDKRCEDVADWQQFTAHTLADLAERKGLTLTWVAAKHSNTADRHIHIALAGSGVAPDGSRKLVYLSVDDFQFLETQARTQTLARVQELQRQYRKQEPTMSLDPPKRPLPDRGARAQQTAARARAQADAVTTREALAQQRALHTQTRAQAQARIAQSRKEQPVSASRPTTPTTGRIPGGVGGVRREKDMFRLSEQDRAPVRPAPTPTPPKTRMVSNTPSPAQAARQQPQQQSAAALARTTPPSIRQQEPRRSR